MYTTLSPCDMCTGACILYKVKRVVVGENKTFLGGEQYLQNRGIEVVVLQNEECIKLMTDFIREKPELWSVKDFQSCERLFESSGLMLTFILRIGMRILQSR